MKLPIINKYLLILKVHYFLFQAGIAPTQTALPVYMQTLGFSGFVVGTVYTVLPLTGLIIKPGLGALADKFKWHKGVMLASIILTLACYFSVQFVPSGFTPIVNNQTSAINFCRNDTLLYVCQSGELGLPYMKAESATRKQCPMTCQISPEEWHLLCNTTNSAEVCSTNSSILSANLKGATPPFVKEVLGSVLPSMANFVPWYVVREEPIKSSLFVDFPSNVPRDKEVCQPFSISSKYFNDYKESSPFCQVRNLCQIRCSGSEYLAAEDNNNIQSTQDDSVTFQNYQIYVFIILLVGSWGGLAAATTLSDTICIAKSGDWSLYGRQRLWGSIGYGLLSIIIGSIVDAISVTGENKNYTPAFYSTLVVLILDVVIAFIYLEVKIPQKSKNFTRDVWRTFLNARILIFLVWCAAMGASMGLAWTFLYWTLEQLAQEHGPDSVASIKTIEGLVNGVQTFIGEVPSFFFAYWVLNKIGHGHCMSLIFLIVGIRYVCYSLLVNPWYILLIEPLQFYYGLFYSTLTSYATIVAPPGTEATVQSLMCAFVEGIGVAIGSFVGGIFMDQYGGQMTFRIFGITFLVLAVVNECIEFFYKMVPRRDQGEAVIQLESED